MITKDQAIKGTRVVVRSDIGSDTDISNAGYCPDLGVFIGKVMTIDRTGEDRGNFTLKEDPFGWWFSPGWVDLSEDGFFEKDLFEI